MTVSSKNRIDLLYDRVDDRLLDSDFNRVDDCFRLLRKEMVQAVEHLDMTLALLTVTNCASEHLPERAVFIQALRKELLSKMTPKDVDAHLYGLD